MNKMGRTWRALRETAKGRVAWFELTKGLCFIGGIKDIRRRRSSRRKKERGEKRLKKS